jgi:hypothetical protein
MASRLMRFSWTQPLGARNLMRFVLIAITVLFYVNAVFEYPDPAVMAVGLVPLVWIALEAVWHLLAEKR